MIATMTATVIALNAANAANIAANSHVSSAPVTPEGIILLKIFVAANLLGALIGGIIGYFKADYDKWFEAIMVAFLGVGVVWLISTVMLAIAFLFS